MADEVWDAFKKAVPEASDDQRRAFARRLIKAFEDADCDTMHECEEIKKAARKPK